MNRTRLTAALLLLAATAVATADEPRRLAIATVHPIATDAAAEVFKRGGNAVDAAIAAALTLGVVDSHNSGIGGGCLALVRLPDGQVLAIDGREMAPAAATRDMFVRNGKAVPELSRTGALSSGVPGAVAAYEELNRTCGAVPFGRLFRPGAAAGRRGFAVSREMAAALEREQKNLRRFPAARAALLNGDGSAPQAGDIVRQPDLARTYDAIAEEGAAWFYDGEFARRTAEWMKANGGVMTAEDFSDYVVKRREPVRSTYRGHTVIGFPPPSSGGVHVAQMLNILEHFDLGKLHRESPVDAAHVTAEAMKLAFADRAFWLGDSDFVDVPRGLTSEDYADELFQKIKPDRAMKVATHGEPPEWSQDVFGRHTTHIAAADSEGYWVAITATINTSFGGKAVIPGTGVVMNNEMDDFSTQPGAPNAFKLVGAENNAVAPGKRPLSSMSPTIVLGADGQPVLTVGAAGGPKIITQSLLAIIGVIDRGLDPTEALATPRLHHQWRPDQLSVERGTPQFMINSLRARGHKVGYLPTAGVTQLIVADPKRGFIPASDPRVEGKADVVTATAAEPALSGAE